MRRKYFTVALVCTLTASLMLTSCIGSFTLSNKLLSWNKSVSNKFFNELIFIAFHVLPVYEISFLADIVVLNSIEFWSGRNPVETASCTVKGTTGDYLIEQSTQGYTITSMTDGSVVRFNYSADTRTWSLVHDGQSYEIFSFIDDAHISLPTTDGSRTVVEVSEQGLYAYQSMAQGQLFAAR